MPLLFLVVAAIAVTFQTAQPASTPTQHPNFGGSWTLDHATGDPRSQSVGGPSFFLGSRLTVDQDGERLVVTQARPRTHPKVILTLDGVDSWNTLPNFHGGPSWQFVSRAIWENNTLVIDTTGAWDAKMRWSITPSGQLSVLEWAPSIDLGMSATHALYSRR
jgi:hypothetical protein